MEALQDAHCFCSSTLLSSHNVRPAECPELAVALNAVTAQIGEGIKAAGFTLKVDQILLIQSHCGRILSCVLADGEPFVLLDLYTQCDRSQSTARWRKSGGIVTFSLREQFQLVHIWTFSNDRQLLTTLL